MSATPKARPRRPWRLRLLLAAGLAYVLWLGVLTAMEPRLVYPRALAGRPPGEPHVPAGVERVWLPGRDGIEVEGWYWPAPPPHGGVVLYFHGNGEIIDEQAGMAAWYRRQGCSMLAMEYRGYGRSGGRPLQGPIVEDAVRFYDWLQARPEAAGGRIVLHGHSLGTGVAAQLATRRPAAGLILEAPYSSIAAFARRYGAPTFIMRNPFRTDEVLPGLTCPILILASHEDEVIPFSHAERLHRLQPAAAFVELKGGHNTSWTGQLLYERAIRTLLEQAHAASR